MSFIRNIPSSRAGGSAVARAAAALVLLGSAVSAHAGLVWQQYDPLVGVLDSQFTTQVNGHVVDVDFSNQVITNAGAQGGHLGMYMAWSWVRRNGSGVGYETLAWDNPSQRFANASAAMEVTHTGHAAEFLRIGDVLGDTWIGVGWTPDASLYAPIATSGDWEVPLFDFGWIGAGESKTYDVRFRFTFADAAAAQDFVDEGGFASYAQGVIASVPEPSVLALAGLALAALAVRARGRLEFARGRVAEATLAGPAPDTPAARRHLRHRKRPPSRG